MDCPACNAPLKPNAKFCGACGTKVAAEPAAKAAPAGDACPACGATLKPNAKFCGACGAKADPAPPVTPSGPPPTPSGEDLQQVRDVVVWNLHPSQVASLIPASRLDAFASARGVVIHEGTRAVIFADGSPVADLGHGRWDFTTGEERAKPERAKQERQESSRHGGVVGALSGMLRFVGNLIFGRRRSESGDEREHAATEGRHKEQDRQAAHERLLRATHGQRLISLLLLRQGPVPLILHYDAVPTATITTKVAIEMLVEIVDPTAFLRTLMAGRQVLGLGDLAAAFSSIVQSAVFSVLKGVPAERVGPDPELERHVLEAARSALGTDWSFVHVRRVTTISAANEDIVRLRQLKEELYLSEQELNQLAARHEFENRLRLEVNRQQVAAARDEVELQRQLDAINRDGLLAKDEFEKFQLLLANERRIREATTEEQYQAALDGLRKSGLLRQEELANLERDIKERREDHAGRRMHALALLDLGRRLEVDKARLEWEHQIGDAQIALELQRKRQAYAAKAEFAGLELQERRIRDQYEDERRKTALEQLRSERRSQIELDREEQIAQLEIARQAQALTEERKRAEHERELAAAAQRAKDEREMKLVEAQRWAGMSVEQIMAANPDLSPVAAAALQEKYKAEAAALAEKYKAEAAANAGDIRAKAADEKVSMAQQQKDEMREFMQQQMLMMQQMMTQVLQSNAQVATSLVTDQGQRVAQAKDEAERREDRMVHLVGRTATTVATATGTGVASASRPPQPAAQPVCAKCGKPLESKFCEDCGP